MISTYPLHFPAGVVRTKNPRRSRFATSLATARDGLLAQLKLLSAKDIILSSNVPLRNDGLPYGRYGKVQDTGVAVYFTYKGQQRVLACDKWNSVEDNIQAICKTVEAIRGMERWGVSEMIERIFTGFTSLPPAPTLWFEILGVSEDCSQEQLTRAYRAKIKQAHPDLGGTADQFNKIQSAYDEGNKHIRRR